jgi:hypothetical protein
MAFQRQFNPANVQQHNNISSVLPAGEYRVLIANSTEGISKSSGKEMITLELNILDAPYDKRKLWFYISDDNYADDKTYQIFRSAGKNPPATIHAGIFKGLVCKIKTKLREYNGEQRAEVAYWIAQTSPAPASDPATGNLIDVPADDKTLDQIPF